MTKGVLSLLSLLAAALPYTGGASSLHHRESDLANGPPVLQKPVKLRRSSEWHDVLDVYAHAIGFIRSAVHQAPQLARPVLTAPSAATRRSGSVGCVNRSRYRSGGGSRSLRFVRARRRKTVR
jgi:hypothetical protein